MKAIRQSRAGVSALAIGMMILAAPQAALAQDADSGASSGGLEDIIVTASKRAVNLQKESRPIVAVDATELQRNGVSDPTDVAALVPGLTIASNGPNIQVSVRGVGDRTINNATDPAVALNVDGIYFPKTYEVRPMFFDLERIEVLKGPQGTLYGRNASSGAMNVITAKPKFELGGYFEAEYGNYDNKKLSGALNVPLSDSVAARISGFITRRDGYLVGGYNDDRSEGVRLHLLIDKGMGTSLLLSGSYAHVGGKGDAAVIMRRAIDTPTSSSVPDPTDPWGGPLDPETKARVAATNPTSALLLIDDGYLDLDVYTLGATFEHDMGWANLTIMPHYVGSKLDTNNHASMIVASYAKATSDQYSIEARLSSPDDARIKWVVGAFGSKEDVNDLSEARIPFPFGTFVSLTNAPVRDDKTWAVFGEANAELTEDLRLIAGARYTWEKKTIEGYSAAVFGPISGYPLPTTDPAFPQSGAAGTVSVDGSRKDTAVNFRAGLEYDLSPESMFFATVATGFKAGGFYNNVAPENSYKPEKLTAYEVGVKNRFFDNRLQLNIEGFYWDYKDKQETFLALLPIGNVLVTQNAGKVTMYGADVSAKFLVTDNDTLSADVEYLHSKYDSYVYSYTGNPDPTINCGTVVSGTTTTRDCSGFPLVRAPKWSGLVSYVHDQPLGDMGTLTFAGTMHFSSSYFISNNFTAITKAKSYQTFDANLTWTSPSEAISVTGYMKNIGNTPVYTGGLSSLSLVDAAVGQIAPPRTYGVRLRYNF